MTGTRQPIHSNAEGKLPVPKGLPEPKGLPVNAQEMKRQGWAQAKELKTLVGLSAYAEPETSPTSAGSNA